MRRKRVAVPTYGLSQVTSYQDKDGNIHVPEVLQPYMGGLKVIE